MSHYVLVRFDLPGGKMYFMEESEKWGKEKRLAKRFESLAAASVSPAYKPNSHVCRLFVSSLPSVQIFTD